MDAETPADRPATQGACGSCRYYSALGQNCHRESPKVFPLGDGQGRVQFISVFPGVKTTDWCGSFSAALVLD